MATVAPTHSEDPILHGFDLIIRILDLTNEEVGLRLGADPGDPEARKAAGKDVQSRRKGRRPLRSFEIGAWAHALGVPVELAGASDSTILRWFADEYAARDSNPEPTDSAFSGQLSLLDPVAA